MENTKDSKAVFVVKIFFMIRLFVSYTTKRGTKVPLLEKLLNFIYLGGGDVHQEVKKSLENIRFKNMSA